ncbi:hypothetical protein BKA70DRAFT_475444 [Coprinopsis sp. MPI-PUGE-AT-0042]|nr:hypothetical protein BKA70DRAFT_475444 [Coprinopsis sp. MPI-PUGE-AT-0042]
MRLAQFRLSELSPPCLQASGSQRHNLPSASLLSFGTFSLLSFGYPTIFRSNDRNVHLQSSKDLHDLLSDICFKLFLCHPSFHIHATFIIIGYFLHYTPFLFAYTLRYCVELKDCR